VRCGLEQRKQGLLARDPVLSSEIGFDALSAIHGRPPT
jgi:hypothetical protein